MAHKVDSVLKLSAAMLAVVVVETGCDAEVTEQECGKNVGDECELYINPEISLADYLPAENELTLEGISSIDKVRRILEEQLEARWDLGMAVKSPDRTDPVKVQNCVDFFAVDGQDAEPVQPSEFTSYRILGIQCHAARLASEAQPATRSYVRGLKLNKELPAELPVDFAFVPSQAEYARIQENDEITNWAQVNDIQEVEQVRDTDAYFRLPGAEQELTLLAFGDFNKDGTEDVLLRSSSYVTDGTYSTTRLFVVTRHSPEADFQILEMFK